MSIETVIAEMTSRSEDGTIVMRPFNKTNFKKLIVAMLNDPDHTIHVPVVKGGTIESVKDIALSADFRNFVRSIVERMGVDKAESAAVMTADFKITEKDVEWVYAFISSALTNYMSTGAKFDFLPQDDLVGSISIQEQPEKTAVKEVRNPATGEPLGAIEVHTEKHRRIVAKSTTPAWLKHCKKVPQ